MSGVKDTPGTSSSGFRFSKYLLPNLAEGAGEYVRTVKDRGDSQVGSDEGASFRITDVLHLMPPLLDARSADVSNVTSNGHHVSVVSLESCLSLFTKLTTYVGDDTPSCCLHPSTMKPNSTLRGPSNSRRWFVPPVTCSSKLRGPTVLSPPYNRNSSLQQWFHAL